MRRELRTELERAVWWPTPPPWVGRPWRWTSPFAWLVLEDRGFAVPVVRKRRKKPPIAISFVAKFESGDPAGNALARFHLSRHSVDRYIERVRPDLAGSRQRAVFELAEAIELRGKRVPVRPWWIDGGDDGASDYIVIDDDLVLPLSRRGRRSDGRLTVTTCLPRVYGERVGFWCSSPEPMRHPRPAWR